MNQENLHIISLSAADIDQPHAHLDEYLKAFVQFNKEWITRYFQLEPSDLHYLSQPKEHILLKGGHIFVALLNNEPIGCCALLHHADTRQWELAKMAVTPQSQGLGAGLLLGRTALSKAWTLGANEVFLEANTKLEASVHLYHKLGFQAVADYTPAYDRCNLYMICKKTKDTVS